MVADDSSRPCSACRVQQLQPAHCSIPCAPCSAVLAQGARITAFCRVLSRSVLFCSAPSYGLLPEWTPSSNTPCVSIFFCSSCCMVIPHCSSSPGPTLGRQVCLWPLLLGPDTGGACTASQWSSAVCRVSVMVIGAWMQRALMHQTLFDCIAPRRMVRLAAGCTVCL